MSALLAICDADASPTGSRDAALFVIGYGGGLRRAELCALDVANAFRLRTVRIRSGKGAFQPLPPSAGPRIRAWLDLRGEESGSLFLPIAQGDRIS